MKRYNWLAACLLVFVIALSLAAPAWLLQRQGQKALEEPRIRQVEPVAFLREEDSTLLRRLQIYVDPDTLMTWLAHEMVEDRVGTAEELSARCAEGLAALLPELSFEEPLRFSDFSILYLYDSRTQEYGEFIESFQEFEDRSVSVELDAKTGLITSLSLWELTQTVSYAFTLEKDAMEEVVVFIGDADDWARRFGAYLGLSLAEALSFTDSFGMPWYCYCDPEDETAQIWYSLYYDDTYVSWSPGVPELG